MISQSRLISNYVERDFLYDSTTVHLTVLYLGHFFADSLFLFIPIFADNEIFLAFTSFGIKFCQVNVFELTLKYDLLCVNIQGRRYRV